MVAPDPELRPSAAELLCTSLLTHSHTEVRSMTKTAGRANSLTLLEQSFQKLSEELNAKDRLIQQQRNALTERDNKIRQLEAQLARLAAEPGHSGTASLAL